MEGGGGRWGVCLYDMHMCGWVHFPMYVHVDVDMDVYVNVYVSMYVSM